MSPHRLLMELPDFGDKQTCLQVDPELFFPDESHEEERAIELAELCHSCPVRDLCLQWALSHTEHGVWAGTTAKDRRKIRRQQGTDPQKQRAQATRATVHNLAAKGLTSRQIIDQTGIHEQTVWRALRAMPTGQSATTRRVA